MSSTIQTDDDSGPEISYGGLARTIVRNLIRRVGTNPSIYIPHPRTLAKSADRLSDLIEIRDQLKSASDSHSKDKPFWQRSWGMAKQMAPGFIRSSIAGTIVFSTYENLYDMFNVSPYESTNIDSNNPSILLTGAIAAACGTAGGILTSTFVTTWDVVRSRLDFSGSFPKLLVNNVASPAIVGPAFMHIMINASMFSCYEMTKNLLFSLAPLVIPPDDNNGSDSSQAYPDKSSAIVDTTSSSNKSSSPLEKTLDVEDFSKFLRDFQTTKRRHLVYDIASITVAGYLAGMVSETVAYYLSPLENAHISSSSHSGGGVDGSSSRSSRMWQLVRVLPTPSLRSILVASIPCSLGFLAYEYGKSEYDEKQSVSLT